MGEVDKSKGRKGMGWGLRVQSGGKGKGCCLQWQPTVQRESQGIGEQTQGWEEVEEETAVATEEGAL